MKTTALIAIIVILVTALGVILVYQKPATSKDSVASSSPTPTPTPTPNPTPPSDSSANPLLTNPSNPTLVNPTPTPTPTPTPDAAAPSNEAFTAHKVVLKTDKGSIMLTLFPEDAPNAVKNFVTLGKKGFYNGIIFHRVIKDFMIQTGDPTGTGRGGGSIFGKPFPDEINNHKIVKGTLAMANSGPNTNGSQFFIVTQSDQPSLDGHYTAFGQTADEASQTVVQAIGGVPVGANDKPLQDLKITGFDIIQP